MTDLFKWLANDISPEARVILATVTLLTIALLSALLGGWGMWLKNRKPRGAGDSKESGNGERREENRLIGRLEGLLTGIQNSQDALWNKMNDMESEMRSLRSDLPGRVQIIIDGMEKQIGNLKSIVDRIITACPLFHKKDDASDELTEGCET